MRRVTDSRESGSGMGGRGPDVGRDPTSQEYAEAAERADVAGRGDVAGRVATPGRADVAGRVAAPGRADAGRVGMSAGEQVSRDGRYPAPAMTPGENGERTRIAYRMSVLE